MERTRTNDSEATRQERDGGQPASARATAEALQAALARISLLERRELALRAALAAAGVEPDAVLARLGLLDAPPAPAARAPSPAHVPPSPPARAPIEEERLAAKSQSARSLAKRLADEVIAGPATLRLRAAARLVDVAGAAAAPALLTAAREAEGALRAGLLEQVGRCGAADAAASVVEFFADEVAEVRAAAIEAAVRLVEGAELEEVIRIGLADGDPRVRRRTALSAASARNLEAGPLLVPLLADPDRQVRRVACTALGGSRDPMAALALLGALLDDEPSVRSAAGSAAEKLFGEQARGIAQLPTQQRARAVARLRSWVAANLVRLAPGGRLQPPQEPEAEVDAAPAAMESVLDELMATGHPGAGFEDDLPGWTEENDPELHAAFARMSGGWIPEAADASLEGEAASLYEAAETALAEVGAASVPALALADDAAEGGVGDAALADGAWDRAEAIAADVPEAIGGVLHENAAPVAGAGEVASVGDGAAPFAGDAELAGAAAEAAARDGARDGIAVSAEDRDDAGPRTDARAAGLADASFATVDDADGAPGAWAEGADAAAEDAGDVVVAAAGDADGAAIGAVADAGGAAVAAANDAGAAAVPAIGRAGEAAMAASEDANGAAVAGAEDADDVAVAAANDADAAAIAAIGRAGEAAVAASEDANGAAVAGAEDADDVAVAAANDPDAAAVVATERADEAGVAAFEDANGAAGAADAAVTPIEDAAAAVAADAADAGADAAADTAVESSPDGVPGTSDEAIGGAGLERDAEAAAASTADGGAGAYDEAPAAAGAPASDEETPIGPPFEAIEEVLRAALRGCTDAALAEELGWDEGALAPAIEAHLAAERLVRRGKKLFLP